MNRDERRQRDAFARRAEAARRARERRTEAQDPLCKHYLKTEEVRAARAAGGGLCRCLRCGVMLAVTGQYREMPDGSIL